MEHGRHQPTGDGSIPAPRSKLSIRPCEWRDANTFIAKHHRHHKPVHAHRFSVSCWTEDKKPKQVGVAVVARPVARMTDQRNIVEVTRLCTDGTPGACSALYAAAARAAKALGYQKIQTFILASEPGTSLKAAGWEFEQDSQGGDWNRPSRNGRRTDQPMDKKQRWGRVLQ